MENIKFKLRITGDIFFEVFQPVEEYEGLYEVSNYGNVRSLNYNHTGKERILKPIKDSSGYPQVNLYKNGKRKMFQVHRLECEAFIPNPDNLSQVNHKDENKENNRVENLEWCTAGYNVNYGTRNKRIADKNRNGKLSIPVLQYSLNGEFIREFPSTMQAQRDLGFDNSNISKCCNGKLNSAYGYKWCYKE